MVIRCPASVAGFASDHFPPGRRCCCFRTPPWAPGRSPPFVRGRPPQGGSCGLPERYGRSGSRPSVRSIKKTLVGMFSIDSVIGEETTSRLNFPHLKGVVGKSALGADEQEGKRDFRSASARSRAAKADRVIAEARAGESPPRQHRAT